MTPTKKTKKSLAKAKSSKKSSGKIKAKSSRKKFPPFTPPPTKIDPESLLIRENEDGSKLVFVSPNFAGVACVYHPERMKEALAGLIFRFIELKRSGEEPDIAMFTAGAGSKIGRVEVRYEDEDLQEALVKYSQMAADYFTEHLVKRLADFPELLIMQVVIATLASMERDGFLVFKEGSGVTEMWDSFNKSMAKKVKKDWVAPKQGIVGIWNEKKRAEALEIYYSVKDPLKRDYPNRMNNKDGEDWLRLIMELGDYDRETAEYMRNSKPGELALTVTGKRLGVVDEYTKEGESYLYAQLSIARAEKKAREEAQKMPRISSDINDLLTKI